MLIYVCVSGCCEGPEVGHSWHILAQLLCGVASRSKIGADKELGCVKALRKLDFITDCGLQSQRFSINRSIDLQKSIISGS